jgi:hypothetical protein
MHGIGSGEMAMRFFSGALSWAFALIPTVYIGGLIWYFMGFSGGSAEGLVAIGLGPTVAGLTVVGVILTLPLLIKLLRFATGANRVPGARALAIGDTLAETEGFDADAALASYMSKRAEGPPLGDDALPAPGTSRPQFGRRVT